MAERNVPKAISTEVPNNNLKAPDVSEDLIRLSLNSKWGVKEDMALNSYRYSRAYLRLANANQLAISYLESQADLAKVYLGLLATTPFSVN